MGDCGKRARKLGRAVDGKAAGRAIAGDGPGNWAGQWAGRRLGGRLRETGWETGPGKGREGGWAGDYGKRGSAKGGKVAGRPYWGWREDACRWKHVVARRQRCRVRRTLRSTPRPHCAGPARRSRPPPGDVVEGRMHEGRGRTNEGRGRMNEGRGRMNEGRVRGLCFGSVERRRRAQRMP